MQGRILKRINYPLPPMILGTANWGEFTDLPEARSQFRTYLQAGGAALNISTTNTPKAVAIAGELLAELTERSSFQIHYDAEKFTNSANFISSITGTINDLGIDHFDLVWFDTDCAAIANDEIVAAISRLINTGKVNYFGIRSSSFWKVVHLNDALINAGITPAGLKIAWSLLQRDLTEEEHQAAIAFGISIVAERALGLGLLSGKYRFNTPSDSLLSRGDIQIEKLLTSSNHAKIEAAATAAEGLGISVTELSLAWLLAQKNLTATVINCKNTAQLSQSLQSLKVTLPSQVLEVLTEVANFG
jgi:aryl-alcohol dehydrogenase-like predicted oxidoreductase